MASNEEIVQKTDMAISDFTGGSKGGLLLPEQADTFIRKLRLQPTILKQVRLVPMSGPQMNINKIGFGSRIMRKAISSTALVGTYNAAVAGTGRSAPSTEQIKLNTQEVIAEIRLPYDVIEDVIERGSINVQGPDGAPQPVQGSFKDTIVDMIIERAALDLEELALLGDSTNVADVYLGMLDGYLVKAAAGGHVVDLATTEAISKNMFKLGIKALPDQYKRNLAAMKHLVSVNNEIEYRDTLANRETPFGDSMIQGMSPVFGYGVPVERTPMMPGTDGLLVHPQNLLFGIQRKISIEVDKDITARVFIIVVTARIDVQIEEADATVRYKRIA